MKRLGGKRPSAGSAALVISIMALVASLAGTGIAQDAVKSVLNKKEKKQTRKIAKSEVNKLAPGLSVANAGKVGNREILYASVNGAGGLIGGTAGTTSSREGVGIYNVVFPRALAGCALVGSPQSASQILLDDADTAPGDATLGVLTFGPAGALQDGRFDVIAYC